VTCVAPMIESGVGVCAAVGAVALDVRGVGGGGEADARPWCHSGWQEQTTESDKRVLPGPCVR